jgi:hypothetical protein
MLIRTAKITGRSHGSGSLCSFTHDSVTIRHLSAISLGQRLQDRLGEHLRLAVAQLIYADPQLFRIVIFGWVQGESEGTLPSEISGHELQVDQSGSFDITRHSVRSSMLGLTRRS